METESEAEQEVEVESESEGGAVRTGWSADAKMDSRPLSTISPSGHRVGVGVAARSAVRRGGAGLRRGLGRKRERERKTRRG